jgi:hypothetical protein
VQGIAQGGGHDGGRDEFEPQIWVGSAVQHSPWLFVPLISPLGCCNCYEFFSAFQVIGNGDGATTPPPSGPKPTPAKSTRPSVSNSCYHYFTRRILV